MKTNSRFLSPPRQWGPVRRALGVWLVLWFVFASPAAFAIDYFVSTTGNDANAGDALNPWRSITRALDQTQLVHATSGDRVNVAAGTYNSSTELFPLSLVNGVALIGAGPTQTVVSGDGNSKVFNTGGTDLGPTTRVTGFDFNNQNTTSSFSTDIMFFSVGANNMSPQIDNNSFDGFLNQAVGIHVSERALPGTFDALIENNTFQNFNEGIFIQDTFDASGHRPFASASPTISNNTFSSNRTGFELAGSSLVLSGSNSATYAPTVQSNKFTSASTAIVVTARGARAGESSTFNFTPLISSNTITGSTGGPAIEVSLIGGESSSASINDKPTIDANVIDVVSSIPSAGYNARLIVGTGTGIRDRSHLSATSSAVVSMVHTISGNSVTHVDGAAIDVISGVSLNSSAAATVTPTISGNTMMHINGPALTMSASIGASLANRAKVTFDPTISNNTMRDVVTGLVLSWSLSGNSGGNDTLTSNGTVTGNKIIPAMTSSDSGGFGVSARNDGIDIHPTLIGWKTMATSWTISSNTVTSARRDGIAVLSSASSFSRISKDTGTFGLTVKNNILTNNTGAGLNLGLGEVSVSSMAQTILITGNTATGNGGNGISLSASGNTTLSANDIQITDNVITGNSTGLVVSSTQFAPGGVNAVLVSCNTVTGNIHDGVIQSGAAPPADFGGGNRNSPGNNQINGNATAGAGFYDFRNQGVPSAATIFAHKNYWGTTNPPTIDSHIFDGKDDPTLALVDYTNPLAAPPVSCGVITNIAPVATDDSYSTPENALLTVTAPGVLLNDTDANGDALTAIHVAGPSNGVLTFNPNGSFTYQPNPNFSGTDSFTYQANDGSLNSNIATVTITVTPVTITSADLRIVKRGPASFPASGNITFTITVANLGPGTAANVVVSDHPSTGLNFVSNSGACNTPFPCTIASIAAGSQAVISSTFTASNVIQVTNTASVTASTPDPNLANNRSSVTVGSACPTAPPELIIPFSGQTDAPVSGTMFWTNVGAPTYQVYLGPAGTGCSTLVATVNGTSFAYTGLKPGTDYDARIVAVDSGCPSQASQCTRFHTASPPCDPPSTPLAGVVGAPSSGRTYSVLVVTPSSDFASYEFDEATNEGFTDATTTTTSATSVDYTHTALVPAVFFYRVRAVSRCTNTTGGYSKTIRVVVVPLSNIGVIDVPAGRNGIVHVQVFIPGDGQPENFTAVGDRSWIVGIAPSSGIIPSDGITLDVSIDPSALPNGTFTATIIASFSPLTNSRKITTSSGKSVPVSINLVTPVVPLDPSQPTANSLIIPAVGHLIGINSQWRSDIRVYNASPQTLQYQLNFVKQGSTDVKQTIITTASGDTTALDDIIHNWYGVGEVGDNATGILEIRPMTTGGDTNPPSTTSLATFVSSRTFDARPDGTVGQFIPAVPFKNFAGAGSTMSMQQVAQSSSYRTNFGFYEASGTPVSLVLSMFNSAGTKLFDLPVSLAGGEQKMLNSLLAQQGVSSLDDGRMQVTVNGGGKVTAYASVVDNNSLDPQLIPAQNLGSAGANLYVVPGIADLHQGGANWQSDLRVYNGAGGTQTTNLTFYPLDNASAPITRSVDINAGEVKVLNNVVQTLFGTSNVGGMVQLSTASASQLVVTARTYNQLAVGTLGQFIKASTSNDAATANGRALNVLQVEDSPRFHTNIGIAEMSGKPATAEISVILPDSKVTGIIDIPLAANEFRQFAVTQFGLGNIYNARVSVKVIDGTGSVTAYGSVIDQHTTDPTYVQAQ